MLKKETSNGEILSFKQGRDEEGNGANSCGRPQLVWTSLGGLIKGQSQPSIMATPYSCPFSINTQLQEALRESLILEPLQHAPLPLSSSLPRPQPSLHLSPMSPAFSTYPSHVLPLAGAPLCSLLLLLLSAAPLLLPRAAAPSPRSFWASHRCWSIYTYQAAWRLRGSPFPASQIEFCYVIFLFLAVCLHLQNCLYL